jgi:hypothetical protein
LEERLKRQEDWLLSDSACVCLFLDKTNALHNVKVKALFQAEKNSLIVAASFYNLTRILTQQRILNMLISPL